MNLRGVAIAFALMYFSAHPGGASEDAVQMKVKIKTKWILWSGTDFFNIFSSFSECRLVTIYIAYDFRYNSMFGDLLLHLGILRGGDSDFGSHCADPLFGLTLCPTSDARNVDS